MTATEWVLAIGSFVIATTFAVAGYFIQKWIQATDESIKDNSEEIRNLGKEVYGIKEKSGAEIKIVTDAVRKEISSIQPPNWEKLDRIETDVNTVRHVIQKEILPQLSSQRELFGRVLVLDDRIKEQELKLVKVFRTVEILAEKKKPDQK